MPTVTCFSCQGNGKVYRAPNGYDLTDADKVLVEAEVKKMKEEGMLKNYWGSKYRIKQIAMKRLDL